MADLDRRIKALEDLNSGTGPYAHLSDAELAQRIARYFGGRSPTDEQVRRTIELLRRELGGLDRSVA